MSASTPTSISQPTTTSSFQPSFNGDDFSNNLFTDLGPLLALFGADVTTQFMSQSLGWPDHILFAIGPLGVVTAIVSAIRVGGPSWLRAFIGRAREPRAEIERALMSSTSTEVCEIWSGESLVRVIGQPKMAELLLVFEEDHRRLLKSKDGVWGVYLKEECEFVTNTPKDDHEATGKDVHEATNLKTPLESEKANEQSNNRSARAEKTRNPLNAPNISLNHTPTPNLAEVILFDVIAVTLQSVVLLLDAFLTYRWKLSKQGRLVSQAAFPLVLAGTIGLTAGMLICSAVVEKSTGEVWYRFKKGQPRQPIKLLWLQKKGVVSDQNFESYAIFAAKERSAVVASTRKKNVPSTRKKYIPFTRKKSIQQEIVEFDNEEFTLKTISIDLVTLVGVFLSVVGYVVQFVGFRQMHWLATIIQLILSATMTAIRSWMRRDLSSEPFHQKLQEGHEMDWLATRDRLYGPNDRADSDSMSSSPPSSPEEITRSPRTLPHTISKLLQDGVLWEREKPQPWYGGDADRYRYKWFIVDCCVLDMKTASTIQGSGSQAETVTLPETVDTIVQGGMELNIADAVLGVRERINNLIGWNSPVQEAASSLTYAIDAVMDHVLDPHLFTMSEEFNRKFFQGGGFEWGFQVGKAKETVYLQVSSGTGQSRTIRPSIEAALSLWVYELSLAEANLPSSREKHPVKNAWRLGPKTDDLERDCIWWVFRESERRYEPGPRSR